MQAPQGENGQRGDRRDDTSPPRADEKTVLCALRCGYEIRAQKAKQNNMFSCRSCGGPLDPTNLAEGPIKDKAQNLFDTFNDRHPDKILQKETKKFNIFDNDFDRAKEQQEQHAQIQQEADTENDPQNAHFDIDIDSHFNIDIGLDIEMEIAICICTDVDVDIDIAIGAGACF